MGQGEQHVGQGEPNVGQSELNVGQQVLRCPWKYTTWCVTHWETTWTV